jgi:heptosyltransferase-2
MASRVVVLQPAFLGDVVFAGPLTRAMAERWPDAEIRFVARPPAHEIARVLPGVTAVEVYDKRGQDAGLSGLRRVAARLRAFAPDLVVSLHESPRTALLAWLTGAPRRLGPAGGFGAMGHTQVESVDGLPFVDRSCAMARALDLTPHPTLELRLSAEAVAARRRELPAHLAALIPGSEWETKRWPITHGAELVRTLRAEGRQVVLLGSPAERELCAQLNALAEGACLDLSGNRVEEALLVLAACETAVGGDSGLTHAARALGIPTVALFGPTSPLRHRAGPRDRFVALGLPCAPCSDHGDRRCPLGHHRCLVDLSAGRVAAAMAELR